MESRKELLRVSTVSVQPVETMLHVFRSDFKSKKVTLEKQVQPTDTPAETGKATKYWLYASNNKYKPIERDPNKTGKWMLFYPNDEVNAVWKKIKIGIQNGDLWHAKVSTPDPKEKTHAIMVYTKDYSDMQDVIRVLTYLEKSGLKPKGKKIRYKTDAQTRAGIYRGGRERPWVYCSSTVRHHLKPTKQEKDDTVSYRRSDTLQWRSQKDTLEKKIEIQEVPEYLGSSRRKPVLSSSLTSTKTIDASSSTLKINHFLLSVKQSLNADYKKYGPIPWEEWNKEHTKKSLAVAKQSGESWQSSRPLSWQKQTHRRDSQNDHSGEQPSARKSLVLR